jgi:isopenicillin N synthase-like dioxygenase
MSDTIIPILDLNQFYENREQFVNDIREGYIEYGFIGIRNHDITDELISKAYQNLKTFFELNESIKMKYHIEGIGGARGYTPFGVEVAKDSNFPDLKEFYHVGRENHEVDPKMRPNIWPEEVNEFKSIMLELYKKLDLLGREVLKAIALALQLDENFFEDKVEIGNSILRPIHYPPIANETKSVRSGQHEDINVITLLVGSEQEGLEILSRKNEWIPVTTIPGTIVCNIGDMLQRHCNDYFPSTTHRVVNPPNKTDSRYSIPFFLHYNSNVIIDTLPQFIDSEHPNKYPKPITADEYLQERLREIGLI